MATSKKLINCTLTSLIGKNVSGITAQVRNPRYINGEMPAQYRIMKKLRTYRENGKDWVELSWVRHAGDSCGFTGCTVESDSCVIQLEPDELKRLNRQSLQKKP